MEPNPGDIYNEGYEAGYKAGKEEIEAAVEAERERIVEQTFQHIKSRGELRWIDAVKFVEYLQALTPTKTDKTTEV